MVRAINWMIFTQSLHRKWLEITKHPFLNGCLGFQVVNQNGGRNHHGGLLALEGVAKLSLSPKTHEKLNGTESQRTPKKVARVI